MGLLLLLSCHSMHLSNVLIPDDALVSVIVDLCSITRKLYKCKDFSLAVP